MGNLLSGGSFKEPTIVEECDSTWETDSELEEEQRDEDEEAEKDGGDESGAEEQGSEVTSGSQNVSNTLEQNTKPKRSFYAARDLYKYRHPYPQNFRDLRCQNDLCNLRFYLNKIPFKPDGVYIEEVLNKWKSDYEELEHNHTYIQWLFPLREQGLNFYAKELTSFEIEEFKKTKEATKRFILAYKMMLDFFGLKLVDKTGTVSRASNWQDRFQHLNESPHNYLRITRILKSLGELGFEHFKPPIVKVFLQESIVENTIPNMKQSALEYFVYTIKERRARRELLRYACQHYQPPEHFIWGPPTKWKVQRLKSIKKNTPTNTTTSKKSLEKHSQKFKDATTEQEPEAQSFSSLEEKLPENAQVEDSKPKTSENHPLAESLENFKDKIKTEIDDARTERSELKPLPEPIGDTMDSSLPKNELMIQNSDTFCNDRNIDSNLIVDTGVEGGKVCLSPVTADTVESITPKQNTLEKENVE